ncbi:Uncharacterised protein [Sphingobacterium spiritivorum]|uniref:DUF4290 domain-containing protein n=1 Tax=Sphingobacterium spiritivorum TaxID=258 RepID=A0A380CLV5_SPHSI|nr:DUF4290 domain-containing protein [Sphingobacterium spiritivorum]SUJ22614.1 Uncharacterised protein [Sphingobacterium spiritivorum]
MNFDYNSTRPKLILAEYGRNVQNMVDYISSLPTKEERNRHAQVVIDMMGVLNPHLRDVADFKHKLWDHLQIISDFKIDVDSPYPIQSRENVKHQPEMLGYPQHNIRFKHYGHTVETMVSKARLITDEPKRNQMILSIANFMKMAYLTWNKDSVSDEQILQDLKELSKGELFLPEGTVLTKLDFKTPPPGSRVKSQTPSSGGSNNNNNNKGSYQQKSNNNNNNNNKKPGGFVKRNNNNNNNGGPKKSYHNNNNNNNNHSNNYKRG